MRYGAGLGRWSIWALAAVVPLGCAAFFLSRRRRTSDDYEAWWRQREQVRTNGNHVEPGRGLPRRDDLFV